MLYKTRHFELNWQTTVTQPACKPATRPWASIHCSPRGPGLTNNLPLRPSIDWASPINRLWASPINGPIIHWITPKLIRAQQTLAWSHRQVRHRLTQKLCASLRLWDSELLCRCVKNKDYCSPSLRVKGSSLVEVEINRKKEELWAIFNLDV